MSAITQTPVAPAGRLGGIEPELHEYVPGVRARGQLRRRGRAHHSGGRHQEQVQGHDRAIDVDLRHDDHHRHEM